MWMNYGHMGWGSGPGGVLGREEFENKRRNLSL